MELLPRGFSKKSRNEKVSEVKKEPHQSHYTIQRLVPITGERHWAANYLENFLQLVFSRKILC